MVRQTRGLSFFVLFFAAAVFLFSQTEDSTKIFEQSKEGVIALYVYGANKELTAKGVAFGLSEDVAVTAYHLISQAAEVEGVNAKGKKMKVEGVIAVDKNLDAALIKLKGKVKALPLGNASGLQSGARVFAVGVNESGDLTISEGTVRSIHKLGEKLSAIESSIAVPAGFNGGPLLDVGGQVIGLLLILERGNRVAIPVDAWAGLSRTDKVTAFKDWVKEDYFAGFEGASLAGLVLAKLDDTGNAQKYLESAVKLNPGASEIYAILAGVYSRQRNYGAAVGAYEKVIASDPNRASAYQGLGETYFRMLKWSEAIPPLEKAVELNPGYKEGLFMIGNAYDELRDFAKAADAYERFLKLNPEVSWNGYLKLGLARGELQQYDLAVAALEEALKAQPRDIKVNYSLAQAQKKAGQFEKAEATFKNLAALNPPEASTYYSEIVKMFDEAGQNEKAVEAARKVVELNPKSEIAVYNLGIMFFKLKRYEEAIQTFQQTLQVKTDYAPAYYNIGYSYYFLKKWKESIDAYKNYVALVPDNADAWHNIGVGYMQLKDFESALEPLKKSVELRPGYGAALYNLAITYINLKDNYSARDVYKTLVNVDPELAEKLRKFLR